MRALVTGCAGFVGRHFTRYLLGCGWQVHGFDVDLRDGLDVDGDPPLWWWRQDALDYFRYGGKYAPEESNYDLVIHAAAVVGGRAKIEGDPLAIAQNLAIDAEMFRWALRAKPARVVYFSSSAVYPTYLQTPTYAEMEPTWLLSEGLVKPNSAVLLGVPDETYGWAKLTGERLAYKARDAGLPVSIFRPFSGYGEDQDLTYPFPAFIERARTRQNPFDIWGDGTQVRDWVHVDDVVGAVMACIEDGEEGPINIGSGVGVSMLELAKRICLAAGYEPSFRTHPDKPAGVAYRVCDPTRMREIYQRKVSLREGIRRALEARVSA